MRTPKNRSQTRSLMWLCALTFYVGTYVHAESSVGAVVNLSGPLMVKKSDGSLKVMAVGSQVSQGDILISEKTTYARVKFTDVSEVTVRPNSQLQVNRFTYDEAKPDNDSAVFSLIRGGMRFLSGALGKRNSNRFLLNTPSATVGIRGTTFVVQYVEPGDTAVACTGPGNVLLATAKASDWEPDSNRIVSDSPLPLLLAQGDWQVAQATPGQGGGLAPGLYVHVIDGLIQLSNRGGVQQFAAGQFGFTGSVVQPPVIVPQNPGIQFNPPPAFQSSTGPQASSGSSSKPKTVDCEVR